MGEAKRRKALDPAFGRSFRSSPQVLAIDEYGGIASDPWSLIVALSKVKEREREISYQAALRQSRIDASCKPWRNEKTALIDELRTMSLAQGCKMTPDRSVYLGANKCRVREIGQRLHNIGGWDSMLYAASFIPSYDHRELDWAWDGIGEWKC